MPNELSNLIKGWTGLDLPNESEQIILYYDFNEPNYFKSHPAKALNFISDYGILCVQGGFLAVRKSINPPTQKCRCKHESRNP